MKFLTLDAPGSDRRPRELEAPDITCELPRPPECKCIQIAGHLGAVKWQLQPRRRPPAPGYLALGDFQLEPYVWLRSVESNIGVLAADDVTKSKDTTYWSIHDVERYFLGRLHCTSVLHTSQYPNLRLPTPLGRHLWRANVAVKAHTKLYQKDLSMVLDTTLKKTAMEETQLHRLIVPDQFIRIFRLDYFKRKSFMTLLLRIISVQHHLQLVCLENLLASRLEGVRLVQQLASFCCGSLKYLYLWRFVMPDENPILVNYSYITGSGFYIPRPETRDQYISSLARLTNLRVLALEYSHIADGTGEVLVRLLPVLKRPHFRLQLICREDHIPGKVDPALGGGGLLLPDTAWRAVIARCPDLYVLMAFYRVRHYDDARRFLSPSVPLREAHWQLSVDVAPTQRQDSDLGCFVRHVAFHFGHNLTVLSIHQWRSACVPLRRVFELLPRLVRLLYVGRVEDDVDLRRTLDMISSGVCSKLKQVRIQIEDAELKRKYWSECVKYLSELYSEVMDLYNIHLSLSVYKI